MAMCGRIFELRKSQFLLSGLLALGWMLASIEAKADEGGVSFWVPGFFGSLAAAAASIISCSSSCQREVPNSQ